jgi:hypothetical protein
MDFLPYDEATDELSYTGEIVITGETAQKFGEMADSIGMSKRAFVMWSLGMRLLLEKAQADGRKIWISGQGVEHEYERLMLSEANPEDN